MLASNRTKKTKETTKAKRAIAVKKLAELLYPRLLIIAYSNIGAEVRGSMEAGRVEQAESLKKQMAAATADFSILCSKEFHAAWKRKRGEFYAD